MKGLFALSLLPLLAASSPVFGVDTIHNEAAPVLSSSEAQPIPDSYIVVFKKEVSHKSACAHHSWVQDQHVEVEKKKRSLSKRSQISLSTFDGLKHTYNIAGGLLGYSGHFDEEVIEKVRRHPDVSISRLPLSIALMEHVTLSALWNQTDQPDRSHILKRTPRFIPWEVVKPKLALLGV